MQPIQTPFSLPGTASIERYQLLLQLAKAANSQLDFSDLLAALRSHLSPIHEVRFVAVLIVEGDEYLPYSLYVSNQARVTGETFGEVLAQFADVSAKNFRSQSDAARPDRKSGPRSSRWCHSAAS